jgi:predicted Zn-dependent protease
LGESGFYKLGQKAGSAFRQARWVWQSATGSEDDAIRAEYGVGRDMAAAVRERSLCDDEPALQAMLDEIGGQLAGVVRNRQHRFAVTLVVEEQPTAFALPGGFIFVARRLVELCERDRDELAFVVAHEMSHVIRRHAIDRVLRQKVLSAASMASPGRGAFGVWLRKVGLEWLERAHSQDDELEADALGVRLVRAAGFDSAGATRLLGRFKALEQGPGLLGLGAYLSTHPPVDERIARLGESI